MIRRKIFVDENFSHELARVLAASYRIHTFRSARDETLCDVDDLELFDDLGSREFEAIITLDRGQLENDDERDGLRKNGLHWIGMSQLNGVRGDANLALYAAISSAGLHHILEGWSRNASAYLLHPPARLLLEAPECIPLHDYRSA